MATLQDKFDYAVNFIRSLPKKGDFQPSNDQKLKFYSYFKQGSIGKCNVTQPGMWYPIERAKWNAWNELDDMDKDEAKQKYIDLILSLTDSFPPSKQREDLISTLTKTNLPQPTSIKENKNNKNSKESKLKNEISDDSINNSVMNDKIGVNNENEGLNDVPFSPIPLNYTPLPSKKDNYKKEVSNNFNTDSLQNDIKNMKMQMQNDSNRLSIIEQQMSKLITTSNKNQQLMKNIYSSEEKITILKNDLQSLFQQVELALKTSKNKLDSLSEITDKVEELEESQHQLIAQVHDKISQSSSFSFWNITSVGIPISILTWYTYSLWYKWKLNKP